MRFDLNSLFTSVYTAIYNQKMTYVLFIIEIILTYLFTILLKNPCKISEPYDNSFWEKSNPAERKKERREITPLIVVA